MTIEYNTKTMAAVFDRWKFSRTQVSRLYNQTNNITVNRYIEGGDIYVSKLLTFCNARNVDLLQYFMHDGKPYYTDMAELAVMEDAGIRVRDILRDRGIAVQPVCNIFKDDDAPSPTGTVPVGTTPHQTEGNQAEPSQSGAVPTLTAPALTEATSVGELIRQLHYHEREALDRQRQDLMTLIDYKDRVIAAKDEEIRLLRDMIHDAQQGKKVSPDIIHTARMVADDTIMEYKKQMTNSK